MGPQGTVRSQVGDFQHRGFIGLCLTLDAIPIHFSPSPCVTMSLRVLIMVRATSRARVANGIQQDGAPVKPISKYQYQVPSWARATQRDSHGNAIPRDPIDDSQDGRLDTRYAPFEYFRRATRYTPPDWARATVRDSKGNAIPRGPFTDTQDGRLDTRYAPFQYGCRAVDADTANVNDTKIKTSQTYSWPGSGIALRIGTGGSDESGLLVKFVEGYI